MRSFAAKTCVIVLMAGPALTAAEERRQVRMKDRTDDRPYSDAVMVGNTLYLAGRIGLDPKTQKPPADAATETRNVLDQIKAVLAQEGMTMDDLVSVQVFCSDVSLYAGFNDIYKAYFTKGYPARAFIGSGPLLFGARFEVQGIAVKR
ncbi:MAG TPA: Rid family hydrolase [Vicinamibacteria bacterium]|jgi:reactive intermediate/imine deaminase|nr:Rid family hydrolase [Vicinamibacteria bacterium]